MSLLRQQRALRQLGLAQTSRLARPPAVLEEPEERPCRCFSLVADDPQSAVTNGPSDVAVNAEGTLLARRAWDAIDPTPPVEIYDWPSGLYLQDVAGSSSSRNPPSISMGHGDVGFIFGNGSTAPEIVKFDLSAASITTLVASGFTTSNPFAGLAFSFYDDQLYGASNLQTVGNALFRVDPTTGARTNLVTQLADDIAIANEKPLCTPDGGVWLKVIEGGENKVLRWDIPTSTFDLITYTDPDWQSGGVWLHGPVENTVVTGSDGSIIHTVHSTGTWADIDCSAWTPGSDLESTIDASGQVVLVSPQVFQTPAGFYRWCGA